jgi:hypothetical protein
VSNRIVWASVFLLACSASDPADAGLDAGRGRDGGSERDATVPDAGALDAGSGDAGAIDGGVIDGGALDAGVIDGGVIDAGAIDGGVIDAGALDAGRDAGMIDAGRDAGPIDAGRADPCTPIPPGLTTWTRTDTASSGTPDTYFFDVTPGDPFCAEITGGGGSWTLVVSNGTSSRVYCSGSPRCSIIVPPGQPTLLVTAVTDDIGGYTLTVRYRPR